MCRNGSEEWAGLRWDVGWDSRCERREQRTARMVAQTAFIVSRPGTGEGRPLGQQSRAGFAGANRVESDKIPECTDCRMQG